MIFEQFAELFTGNSGYFYILLRSLVAAVVILIGQLAISLPVGFLLGRFRFRLRLPLLILYTVVLFLPYSATLLPNYIVISNLHLLDTQLSIILPAIFSPTGAIILTIFVSGIPQETIDAALLETNNIFVMLSRIIMPQIKSGIALAAFITFLEAWNMVEQPYAMMNDSLNHPMSVLMNSIFGSDEIYNFAGVILYILPPFLLLFAFLHGKISPTKTITVMLCATVILVVTAAFVYEKVTPKVYAMSPAKLKIEGVLYDCVIPLDSISSDGKIYIASPKKTVLGTRYTAYEYAVEIEHSDGKNAAIAWDSENSKKFIILAYERKPNKNENVNVLLNSDTSNKKVNIKLKSQNGFAHVYTLLDNLKIPYRSFEDGMYCTIETRADLVEIVKNICHGCVDVTVDSLQ